MKKLLLTIAILAPLAACSSVDLDPTDKYDSSYAFSSAANARLSLNWFYKQMYSSSQFGSGALCGGTNASLSDGLTDILKYGAIVSGAGDCNLIMTVDGQQSVSQNYFDAWTTCYGYVRRINEFLDGLDTYASNFSEAEYASLKAEALFFRAWNWYLILRSHASAKDDLGAILYTSIDQMSASSKDRARSTVADSWAQFTSDISFAASKLPEPAAAAGRLHRYAALALEARGLLYAGDYAGALAAAEQITASGLYSYVSDYASIFESLDNSEVIWGCAYSAGELTHSFDLKFSQPGDYCASGDKGGGYAGPTQEFVDSYDNADGTAFDPSDASRRFITASNVGSRDPRLAASVLYNGASFKGRELQCYEGGVDQKYMPYGTVNSPGNTVTGYYMRKLLDESNTDYRIDGSYQPWPEFRYAEIMLITAECQAAAHDFAAARATVAELRKARFGRDDVYTAPVADFESALDLILKERSIELCFEGHRFWDLRRTGRAASVLDGKKYTGVLWSGPAGEHPVATSVSCDMGAHNYPERFDRFPIPQTEIANNTLARQNSDW